MKSTFSRISGLVRRYNSAKIDLPQPYHNLIILSGIGKSAFSIVDIGSCMMAFSKSIKKFQIAGINSKIFRIGDEKNGISTENFTDQLKRISDNTAGNISIIIYSHAFPLKDPEGNFTDLGITLNPTRVPSKELLSIISETFPQRKTDIFLTCCRGGLVVPHVDVLSKGSTIVSCVAKNELMDHNEVMNFSKAIESYDYLSDFSAQNILRAYLAFGLQNQIAPLVAVSGSGLGEIDLQQNLFNKLGKKILPSEEDFVHQKLDDIMGVQRVESLMKNISQVQYMGAIKFNDYGPALIVAFELQNARQINNDIGKFDAQKLSNSQENQRS